MLHRLLSSDLISKNEQHIEEKYSVEAAICDYLLLSLTDKLCYIHTYLDMSDQSNFEICVVIAILIRENLINFN